ncbi:MAG TPA: hypothetical protein ENI98_00745 [Gammaproteobacteria bacterium]|nr:hypothetical protein [Gammaproteobacteria bacterium]
MTKTLDDFEAVRVVVQTLEPFDSKDRERIIRWAREKLGMHAGEVRQAAPVGTPPPTGEAQTETEAFGVPSHVRSGKDIKTFVSEKSPSSDRQLAATVAYYYAFEAPETDQKDSIDKDDLIDACRKAGVRRPTNPGQTLRNAAHAGYLDRADTGKYRLNSVGENLVAMVLPESGGAPKPKKKKKAAAKKKKVSAKKKRTTKKKFRR